MPTATNSIIYLYKGVPLLKGGTEVLYVYQDNAITQLESFLHRTFFQYYYVREERQYVRIKATMPEVEGCNYLAFRNPSNGNKWFFGFIDRLVYINDNTVEIEFTIDPFPTYLGDTSKLDNVFVVRNTVSTNDDTRGAFLQDDYVPNSAKVDYISLGDNSSYSLGASNARVYYAVSNPDDDSPQISANFINTGVRVGRLTNNNIQAIKENGGVIIGAYLMPNDWISTTDYPIVRPIGELFGNPLAHVASYSHNKIKTGVYNKVVLITSQGARNYELELFSNVNDIRFKILGLMTPCPSVFIYPTNYKGMADNLAEGMYMKCPSIPISANAVYTNAQRTEDALTAFKAIGHGALSGASAGFMAFGAYGALAGGILGSLGGALGGDILRAKNQHMTQFMPPTISGQGEPVVAYDFSLKAQLFVSSPSQHDLYRISKYFDYFGYNIDSEMATVSLGHSVNFSDGAYLQIGSDLLVGSEVDNILNARLRQGIKIRKTLSSQGA